MPPIADTHLFRTIANVDIDGARSHLPQPPKQRWRWKRPATFAVRFAAALKA